MSLDVNRVKTTPITPNFTTKSVTLAQVLNPELISAVTSTCNLATETFETVKNVGPTALKAGAIFAVCSVGGLQAHYLINKHPPRSYPDELIEGGGVGVITGFAGGICAGIYTESDPYWGGGIGAVSGGLMGLAAGWISKFIRGSATENRVVIQQVVNSDSEYDATVTMPRQMSAVSTGVGESEK